MFTLRYSYDNFGIEENNILYRLIILYFYEYWDQQQKNYEFGWHYALLAVWKKN